MGKPESEFIRQMSRDSMSSSLPLPGSQTPAGGRKKKEEDAGWCRGDNVRAVHGFTTVLVSTQSNHYKTVLTSLNYRRVHTQLLLSLMQVLL